MGKHTPGTWVYFPKDDWGVVRVKKEDGYHAMICQARDYRVSHRDFQEYREKGIDPFEANARLIAAAPELLEALKKYQAFNRLKNDRDAELFDIGEQAIKKAEGDEG